MTRTDAHTCIIKTERRRGKSAKTRNGDLALRELSVVPVIVANPTFIKNILRQRPGVHLMYRIRLHVSFVC